MRRVWRRGKPKCGTAQVLQSNSDGLPTRCDPTRRVQGTILRLVWSGPYLRSRDACVKLPWARHDERTARANQNRVLTRNRCPSSGRAFARVVRRRGQGQAVHTSIGAGRAAGARVGEKIASTPAPRSPALSSALETSVESRRASSLSVIM